MLAAIDAGSNTLRMLIGSVERGRVVPQTYLRRICRLAGGASPEQGLTPEAMARTLGVLREFAGHCQENDIVNIGAVGTAAFRHAVNGGTFVKKVRKATGLPLRIITGDEEARLTTKGVLSALSPTPDNALIIDVGGGSTEYVLSINKSAVWSASFPLGVVHLTEKCCDRDERLSEISKVTAEVSSVISQECRSHGVAQAQVSLVGTAGTVTTLAALDQEMEEYDWQRANNYPLMLDSLLKWYHDLLAMSPTEREELPGMEVGRGDLIIAGMEIVLSLIQSLESDSITACDFGILEGLLLSMEEDRFCRSFD
jgi:exopolyphosphatase/guanosine-5'-triphosphate,3'-diphosphate pyrophosphatase